MKITRILRSMCIGLALGASTANAFAPVNFFRPEDRTLRLPFAPKTGIKFGLAAEYGSRSTGMNWEGKRRNVLQLYEDRQAAAWMLRNPSAEVYVTNGVEHDVFRAVLAGLYPGVNFQPTLDNNINDATDNTRGYQVLTGKYHEFDMTLMAGVKVLKTHGRLALNLYAPVKYVSVADVKTQDMTVQTVLDQRDIFVRRQITNNLKSNVLKWGALDLSNWRKAGWGDLLVMLDWSNRYTMEMKHILKAMTVGLRGGVSCPTGVKKDVDQAFSMAFGNDDAWAIPLGATMELDLWTKIKLGCNVDWLGILDKGRTRRLKTDTHQTEFLLLNKGAATRSYGVTWNLEPYLQFFHFYKKLSARVAYQYFTHDKDILSVKPDSGFDGAIINTAHSLQPWRVHNMIFNLNYDLALCQGGAGGPGRHSHQGDGGNGRQDIYTVQCGLFYKMPFKGRGIVDAHTFGGQLAVNW